MKRTFSFLLGFICLSLIGCEDDKLFKSFSSASDLEGVWVRIDEEYNCRYSYEMKGDKLIYREHSGHIDEENYFVCSNAELWNSSLIKMTLKYEFDKEEQALYIAGIKAGVITRTGKDKAYYKAESGIIRDCTLSRVQGIKEGPKEEEYGYSDPDAIDLTKYNPQDDPQCWEVKCTSKGATATTYTWANEYFVAAGAKVGLEAAQKEGISVSYSWSTVSAANEQACLDKNNN